MPPSNSESNSEIAKTVKLGRNLGGKVCQQGSKTESDVKRLKFCRQPQHGTKMGRQDVHGSLLSAW